MLSTKFKIIRVVFENNCRNEIWPAGSKKWFFSNKGIDQTFYNKEDKTCLHGGENASNHLDIQNTRNNSLNPLTK